MPKVSYAYSTFTAGEVSPKLFGRTDLAKYNSGAAVIENFLVQPHGGVVRRPGTRFISEVKTSANAVRLIPFEFNVEQAYVLEFGPSYFRVYKDGGQVTSGGSAVEVATVYTAADLDGLKYAQTADVMYICSPNHPIFKITRTSHTAWTITEVTTQRGPMLDPNTTTTTLTPNAHSGTIQLTASASTFVSSDVGRLVKVFDGFVKIASFTSATVVAGAAQELEDGRSEILPSYAASTISFHEGDPDSTGLEHNDRIEDTAGGFIDEGFKNGQLITISGTSSNNSTAGHLIVDVTDTVITLAPGADLANESAGSSFTLQGKLEATTEWSLGAFSNATGFPRAVTFYEQRLVFAGTSTQPQTLFFSQGDDFENFESGTEADDGIVVTIGSNVVNVIRFLASTRNLIVGTSGGEFVVRAGASDEALTPKNIQIKQQTSHGAADQPPVQAGNSILFVQRAKRKVLELQFNFDVDGFVAPDLALISEHITENGLDQLIYQQEPNSILWSVRGDGQLACMTYKPEEKVIGWSRQILGGSFESGNAVVESIATIPGDLDEDQVFMAVKRDLEAAATCTLTVTDFNNIATNATITLTSNDGVTETFTCQGSGAGSPDAGKFFTNTSNDVTADNIFNCINAASSRFSAANPSANVITITRVVKGDANLTTTTSDAVRLKITNFDNGRTTKRYIEFIKNSEFGTDIYDAVFVDSALTFVSDATTIPLIDSSSFTSSGSIKIGNEVISYTGNSSNQLTGCTRGVVAAPAAHDNGTKVTQTASSLSGLSHLEGESVSILADGSVHGSKTVASGAVTLDRHVTRAHVGLAYNSTLETLRVDAGSAMGTSQGKIKRINDITVRLDKTVGLKVGLDVDNLDVVPFRSSANSMNAPISLFSGDKTIEFNSDFDTDGKITIRQDQPLPMTVLSVYATLSTFDQ
jgi:hypothetical protein